VSSVRPAGVRDPTGAPPPIRIPWASPAVGDREAEAARAAIAATRLSMGAGVRRFEAVMAARAERRHALAVSNGTVALEVAMRLLGLAAGDEVLVSSLSYIATVNCIVRVGARPVFCDVVPDTLNIDPDDVAARITPRTRVLLLADYCGFSVDYRRLLPIAGRAGVTVVVDGAQSIGTSLDGRPALARGAVSTTSFHAAKIMTTGEGGMVLFDDDEMLEPAQRFRGQGEVPGRKYIHDTLGFNCRLTDVQAEVGLVQESRLDGFLEARRRLAARYADRLAGRADVGLLSPLPGSEPAWFSLPVLVPDRDGVAASLRAAGIETRSLYPIPTYRQPIPEYGGDEEPRPRAEAAAAAVLNLPVFYAMSDAQVDEVCDALAGAVGAARGGG
jgi:perosamine synthetase